MNGSAISGWTTSWQVRSLTGSLYVPVFSRKEDKACLRWQSRGFQSED